MEAFALFACVCGLLAGLLAGLAIGLAVGELRQSCQVATVYRLVPVLVQKADDAPAAELADAEDWWKEGGEPPF